MAHELSHVVLDSIRHELRQQEEAVDLTAMHRGYGSFYFHGAHSEITEKDEDMESFLQMLHPVAHNVLRQLGAEAGTKKVKRQFGYLTKEEVRYALMLMRT